MRTRDKTVSAYITAAPPKSRPMLRLLRKLVKSAVPGATESISYGMPSYAYHGRLAYYAAFRDHVSLFMVPRILLADLEKYRSGKSTLRFQIGRPIPARLITRVVRARARENERRVIGKSTRRTVGG